MKLRNKKTGEIVELLDVFCKDGRLFYRLKDERGIFKREITSLAKLNEEWEDYEEPKEYFYIYADGDIYKDMQDDVRKDNGCKEIGNYFETKEQAEKAVEKLKAIKRLKDKGFKFDGWDENHHNLGIIEFSFDKVENSVWDFEKDLYLLFGGEE